MEIWSVWSLKLEDEHTSARTHTHVHTAIIDVLIDFTVTETQADLCDTPQVLIHTEIKDKTSR